MIYFPVSEVLKAGGAIKEPQIIDLRLFYDHFCPVGSAERQGYEPTPSYLSNSMRYQYVKALGGTT